jgi:2-dehydropantoate 2-reductase
MGKHFIRYLKTGGIHYIDYLLHRIFYPVETKAKILVLGAGAVGLPFAAKLSSVADVVAVSRERYSRAITSNGLSIHGAWGSGTYRFRCTIEPPDNEDFDYILITAKSNDTEQICRTYADLIRGRNVASFQNGIGNEETIQRYTDRVIGGVVMTGFVTEGNREIAVTANAGAMKIGRFPTGLDPDIAGLASLMGRAGIPVEITDRIRDQLWSKNMINCALNPLSAIMEVPYGALKEQHCWAIIEDLVREIYSVTRADGINPLWGDPDAFLGYLHGALIPVMADHCSSMLQDIRHGHRTEIDYLNGAVVLAGKRTGVGTPVNSGLCDCIRFRQNQFKHEITGF